MLRNSLTRIYKSMEELTDFHSDGIINGIQISGEHRFAVDGKGSYHRIIEIPDENPYGYDNIVISQLGTTRTAHFIQSGEVVTMVNFHDAKALKLDDIILLDKKLYHIPTGKFTRVNESETSVVKEVESAGSVIDIRGKDKQIEWTGSEFVTYENINSEDVSDEDEEPILYQENYRDSDIRDDMDDEKKSYRELLNNIVRNVSYINNRHEAEKYLNGNFEISGTEKTARKFANIKRRYAKDLISIEQFENEVAQFFNENEEYIYTAFENSNTQLSKLNTDIEVGDDENNGEEDNSLLNW